MKLLVIIRTCLRDDFISYYCYQSFKKLGVEADYLFFAESSHGKYEWITRTGERITYRPWGGNLGGFDYAVIYIECLKHISLQKYDTVIISDADIVLQKNPLELEYDFGGIQDANNKRHFSGQFQIYKSWLLEKVVNYPDYKEIDDLLISKELSIADDTLMSWAATMYTDKTFNFSGLDYWLHHKLYHLEKEFTHEHV